MNFKSFLANCHNYEVIDSALVTINDRFIYSAFLALIPRKYPSDSAKTSKNMCTSTRPVFLEQLPNS